jgi:hypothetical protein
LVISLDKIRDPIIYIVQENVNFVVRQTNVGVGGNMVELAIWLIATTIVIGFGVLGIALIGFIIALPFIVIAEIVDNLVQWWRKYVTCQS